MSSLGEGNASTLFLLKEVIEISLCHASLQLMEGGTTGHPGVFALSHVAKEFSKGQGLVVVQHPLMED